MNRKINKEIRKIIKYHFVKKLVIKLKLQD
jgi:hypothetical protein